MHRTLEPYHGMIYFVAEAFDAYAALGITSRRMGYFSSRAAPMGAVPAEVVIATFFNFEPALVRKSIPAAWRIAGPKMLTTARRNAADAALRRLLGDAIDSREMDEAAALARTATEGCFPEGRPLYAGHASLDWPHEPHLVLWHAQTLLREFRGDGHIAALTAAGITGPEALVVHDATGDLPRGVLQQSRAWGDDAWNATVKQVRERGWLDDDGELTEAGRASRAWVEDRTDALMVPCWERLGDDGCQRLRTLVRPWSTAIAQQALQIERTYDDD
jgi:hypothetical protein